MKIGKIKFKYIASSLRLNSDYHLSEGVAYDRIIKEHDYKTLGQLSEEIFTGGRSKRMYVEKQFGIPYLGNADLMSSSPLTNCKYTSSKFWRDRKSMLEEGMILTGRVGQNTVGSYSYATKELENTIGSDNVIRIINNETVKNGYLYSFLASKYGYHLSRRHISGNAQPFVTEDMLAKIPVPIFPQIEQDIIHDLIVEAADLRVEASELLRGTIDLFEKKIGQSIMHKGFQYGSISSIALNNFHKRFDSQYQLLWQGLKKENVSNIEYKKMSFYARSIFVGGRGKRNYVTDGIPFLSSSEMMVYNSKRGCKKVSKNTSGLSSMLVSKKDILISRSGTVGNVILVGEDLCNTAISEHALRLVIDAEKISPNYVFCYLRTKHGLRSMEASSFGSVIITLNEDLIGNIDLPILDDIYQKIIEEKIEDYLTKMDLSTLKENQAISLIEQTIDSWQSS